MSKDADTTSKNLKELFVLNVVSFSFVLHSISYNVHMRLYWQMHYFFVIIYILVNQHQFRNACKNCKEEKNIFGGLYKSTTVW